MDVPNPVDVGNVLELVNVPIPRLPIFCNLLSAYKTRKLWVVLCRPVSAFLMVAKDVMFFWLILLFFALLAFLILSVQWPLKDVQCLMTRPDVCLVPAPLE